MKVIEITETIDTLADYANSQEVIILTRNGQAIATLTPLKFDQNIDNISGDFREMIEENQSRKKLNWKPLFISLSSNGEEKLAGFPPLNNYQCTQPISKLLVWAVM